VHPAYDISTALMRVQVDAQGAPSKPAARGFWDRAMDGSDLPDDPATTLRESADDRPIDAGWLAGLTVAGDIRSRNDRVDQFAFGQRVFSSASTDDMSDVLVAVRAFRRYRMLMLTLERMGIRNAATYAAAARVASRLSPSDPTRAFLANAQFQGALALLTRMRAVGSLDARKTDSLLNSLLAIPINSSSEYMGGLLLWITEQLRPAIPAGDSLDEAVQAALSGPDLAGSRDRAADSLGRTTVPC
jgi:hypothetical protein